MTGRPLPIEPKAELKHSPISGVRSPHSGYLLDNAAHEAWARLASLSALFDAGTVRHLEECGVVGGWRCLEVGAGNGSIAQWLADRVGSTGSVLATDVDPRFVERLEHPNLEVRCHDVAADPLPDAAFDLVHCRMVLRLLDPAKRENAMTNMICSLKPGGWLIDEDLDTASMAPDPRGSPGEVVLKTQMAMMRLFEDRGVDTRFGRLLFGQLRRHGLVNVGAEGRVLMWHSGSPGAAVLRGSYQQLRTAMIAGHYVTEQQLEEDLARLDSPDFMMPSGILWSAWGQRP